MSFLCPLDPLSLVRFLISSANPRQKHKENNGWSLFRKWRPILYKMHGPILTFLLCWQICFPFIQHILCRYLQHLQLFGNPSLGIPHKFTLICPPKLTQCPSYTLWSYSSKPPFLHIIPWWFLSILLQSISSDMPNVFLWRCKWARE